MKQLPSTHSCAWDWVFLLLLSRGVLSSASPLLSQVPEVLSFLLLCFGAGQGSGKAAASARVGCWKGWLAGGCALGWLLSPHRAAQPSRAPRALGCWAHLLPEPAASAVLHERSLPPRLSRSLCVLPRCGRSRRVSSTCSRRRKLFGVCCWCWGFHRAAASELRWSPLDWCRRIKAELGLPPGLSLGQPRQFLVAVWKIMPSTSSPSRSQPCSRTWTTCTHRSFGWTAVPTQVLPAPQHPPSLLFHRQYLTGGENQGATGKGGVSASWWSPCWSWWPSLEWDWACFRFSTWRRNWLNSERWGLPGCSQGLWANRGKKKNLKLGLRWSGGAKLPKGQAG